MRWTEIYQQFHLNVELNFNRLCHWIIYLFSKKTMSSRKQLINVLSLSIFCQFKWNVGRTTQLYVRYIVQMYGISIAKATNENKRFQAHFWQVLLKALGTHYISTILIILTNGPTPRGNQSLEDMFQSVYWSSQRKGGITCRSQHFIL